MNKIWKMEHPPPKKKNHPNFNHFRAQIMPLSYVALSCVITTTEILKGSIGIYEGRLRMKQWNERDKIPRSNHFTWQ